MSKAYTLYKNGEYVNSIAADEAFVTEYAAQNGYTFEEIIYPEPEEPEPMPSAEERIALLSAQLEATQAATDYLLLNTI